MLISTELALIFGEYGAVLSLNVRKTWEQIFVRIKFLSFAYRSLALLFMPVKIPLVMSIDFLEDTG